LEEIAMQDDDHDDVVHDLFVEALYGDTPLGRNITGTPDTINAMSRRQISGYYHRHYTADRLVFSAAGRVDHNGLVTLVRSAFAGSGALGDEGIGPGPVRRPRTQPTRPGTTVVVERPAEQTTFVMGLPAYPRNHPRRFALGVLNSALGGGTSSRLFQEVRERRGLAYTIYSFGSQHVDGGYFAIGGACTPRNLLDVLGICRDELAKVASAGLTVEEFERGKGQLRGSLVMGLEDSSARMTRIGKAELVPGGLLSIDETLARINAVTLDDVHAVAQELLTVGPTLAALGPAKAVNKLL
ncbi:MAG: insulinase family protein, partial [Actinomycetota bacterium]|nr:insulinase family protein [Actinomycetota bacterium]